jgi:RNA polymerase sigma factor (sigma-70 family)
LESFFKSEPSAHELAEFNESCGRLLEKLDVEYRELVFLKLQGYTQDEISERLGLSVRTIHRRLQVIRSIWSDLEEDGDGHAKKQIDDPAR